MKKINKPLLITGGIIISLILLYFIYRDYRPELTLLLHMSHHNKLILLHMIRSHGIKDMLLLLALIATFNAIPGMSNSFVCIFVGLCYGPAIGFIINWLGNIIGNCGVMAVIRKIDLSRRTKKSKLLNSLMNQRHPSLGLRLASCSPSFRVSWSTTRGPVSISTAGITWQW